MTEYKSHIGIWDDSNHDIFMRSADERRAKRRFSRIGLSVLLYLLVSYTIVYVLQLLTLLFYGPEATVEYFSNIYIVFAIQIFSMYIVAFPIFRLSLCGMRKKTRKKRGVGFGEFAILFFVAEFFMIAGNIIGTFITTFVSFFTGRLPINAVEELTAEAPIWLVFILVCVFAPIFEELIFRKLIIDRLSVYGDRLAIVISSILFGLFHGNFSQLFYATALGCVLGYLYCKGGKLRYSVLMHSIINFFGGVLPLLALSSSPDMPAQVALDLAFLKIIGLAFIQYGSAIVGCILLIIGLCRGWWRISTHAEISIPSGQRASVVFGSVGSAVTFILLAATVILSVF